MCPRLTNRLRVLPARYDKLHQQDIHYPQQPSNQITITAIQEWASSSAAALLTATHKLASFCHIGGAAELKISSVSFPPDDTGAVNAGWLRNVLPVKLTHFVWGGYKRV